MPQSFREFRERLLIALAKASQEQANRVLDLKQVADAAGLQYQPGWIRQAGQLLDERRQIHGHFSKAHSMDEGVSGLIKGQGLEDAEELIEKYERSDEPEIPASNRYVRISHNSDEFRAAEDTLQEVTTLVRQSNEYATQDPEDQEQRLAEIESGHSLLNSVRVRIDAIKTVLISALKYLTKKFADHAIGYAAGLAIGAVLTLLGIAG